MKKQWWQALIKTVEDNLDNFSLPCPVCGSRKIKEAHGGTVMFDCHTRILKTNGNVFILSADPWSFSDHKSVNDCVEFCYVPLSAVS